LGTWTPVIPARGFCGKETKNAGRHIDSRRAATPAYFSYRVEA